MTNLGLLLTLIFAVLKLIEVTAVTSWTWFQVFTPLAVGVGIDIVFFLIALFFARKASK